MSLRCIVIVAAGATLWVATILGTACGGGEGQPGPQQDGGQQETPTAAAATPVARPTVDPNVLLVEYQSPDKGYTVSYPEGWLANPTLGGDIDTFIWTEEGTYVAQLAVSRNADMVTPDALMSFDLNLAYSHGGHFDPAQTRDIQVGGTTGREITYSATVGTLTIEQEVVYTSHGGYGWRVALSTYGTDTLPGFSSVFQRIIDSFQPG